MFWRARPGRAEVDRIRRSSLRTVLLRAFILQIVAIFALVGWLTFRNNQDAVDELSRRLARELAALVQDRLRHYTAAPVQLLETYTDAMQLGVLRDDDFDYVALVFWNALQHNADVGYLSYGNIEGHFVGAQRFDDGSLRYRVKDSQTNGRLYTWATLPGSGRGEPIEVREEYDPHVRPWFVRAVQAMDTAWSDVYASASSSGNAFITAVRPAVSKEGDFRGVVGADIILSQAASFLEAMTRDQAAIVFVVEDDGRLIATSTGERVVTIRDGQAIRPHAASSAHGAIRAASHLVDDLHGGFRGVGSRFQHSLTADGERYVLELRPLADGHGLRWVIGVLIPERFLEGHVRENTRDTLLLCLLALLVAMGMAVSISRRITRPIGVLAYKARSIQDGDLDVVFDDPSTDEIGALGRSMAEMVQGLRDRDVIRDAFGRYVTPELAEQLLEDPKSLALGGESRRVTILMSDLRGFTGLSERLPPQEMVALLNRYLGAMTDVILQWRGTIVEFIGDAILVIFGAPFSDTDDVERAVRCAIDMQIAMTAFNAESLAAGQPALDMGIGLNTGEVIAGNIGSERAAKYGAVGEAVNLTARIESLTVRSQVLLSDATAAELTAGVFELVGPKQVRVKGVSEPLRVWEALGTQGPDPRRVPKREAAPRQAVDVAAELFFMVGSRLDEVATPARITELSRDRLVLTCRREPPALGKIMLRLEVGPAQWTGDLYGIVEDVAPTEGTGGWQATLALTSMRPTDLETIEALLGHSPDPD